MPFISRTYSKTMNALSQSEANGLARDGDSLIIVGPSRSPDFLVFACPDGCGEIVRINLKRQRGKAWRLYQDANKLTISPSVALSAGCRTHFVLRSNIAIRAFFPWNEKP